MNVGTGLCHCSNWKSMIPFRVYLVLDPQAFVDLLPFLRDRQTSGHSPLSSGQLLELVDVKSTKAC